MGTDFDAWKLDEQQCPRCGQSYFQVQNIGTWRCAQPIIGRHDRFVRADHMWQSHFTNARFTRAHDIELSDEIMSRMKLFGNARPLDDSLVQVKDALPRNQEYVQDLLARSHVVVRRYDCATEQQVLQSIGDVLPGYSLVENPLAHYFPGMLVVPSSAVLPQK